MRQYPKNEPVERIYKIRQMMNARGLDCLIVYSNQWRNEAVHYVGNLRLIGEDACIVLPLVGDPVLFTEQAWDLPRIQRESWIADIRVTDDIIVSAAAMANAPANKHIGFVGFEIMPAKKYMVMQKLLSDKQISNEYASLSELAKVKSEWELSLMRECAHIADCGYLAAINALHVGMSEYEIVAEIENAMKAMGADDNFQMIGVGTNLTSMKRATDSRVKMGDFLLAEITPFIGTMTYATQLCRTVKIGQATPVEREKHELLCEALQYALSNIKAGIRAKDIAFWQNEIIGGAGYEKYCHPPFMRSRGHNFGLGYIELDENNEEILRENTVLVIHPNQLIPETGYMACGLTVRITNGGVEVLSDLSPKMPEIIPVG